MVKAHIKKLMAIAAAFVAVLIFYFSSTSGGGAVNASAASSYSNVLDDLQKDPKFDPAKFSENAKDKGIYVIQIAESTAGELFVYVHQPAAKTIKLQATELRFSTAINENFKPKDYTLTFLNRNGIFAKYLIDDFTVKSDTVRYYDIVQISRIWLDGLDKPQESNDLGTVAFAVGMLFTACTVNDTVSYTSIENSVIEINPESKFVGYFNYFDGLDTIISYKEADCWYVGFDTNKPIDYLTEVELSFKKRTVERNYALGIQTAERFGEWQSINNYIIKGTDKGSTGNGFLAHRYEWKRIVSINEFLTNPDYKLSDIERENMRLCKWVLRFYETERKTVGDYKTKQVSSSQIADVTILRLKFKTDGETFNLGVVDNKQSPKPDQPPGNADYKSPWELYIEFCQLLEELTGISYIFWAVFFIVLVFCVLFGILSIFFPALRLALKVIFMVIGKGISAVFKVLWWVISLPFRGIAALANGIQARSKNRPKPQPKHKQVRRNRPKRTGKRRGKKRKGGKK